MYTYRDCAYFDEGLKFFKGNVHCHSEMSDGQMPAVDTVRRYVERGYDFLCFTDHEVFTARRDLAPEGFLIIPGAEWAAIPAPDGKPQCHHINIIEGTREMLRNAPLGNYAHGERLIQPLFEGAKTVREMLEVIKGHGCIATYNHPKWSHVRACEMGLLEGFAVLEVHNYGCELEDFTGYCETYWDELLQDGSSVPGGAADDNHNHKWPDDSFGGWIQVYAHELTQDAIISAIVNRQFYPSTGPELMRYGIKNGVCYVECSPVHHVQFVCGGGLNAGTTVWSRDDADSITRAEHEMTGREQYIRIRCERKDGKVAWSQPILAERN